MSLAPASSILISDGLVILGAAGLVIPLFARFRITPIIGFILVGIAVGPFGLGRLVPDYPWLNHVTISDPAGLHPFAEFGVIMVLFGIGLELSFERLWKLRRRIFGLGALELLIAGAGMAAVLALRGEGPVGAIALGIALALSSTALVLPISGVRSSVGRAALAMLLFEDLALVPILFVLGAMAPGSGGEVGAILRTLALGAAVVAVLLIAGRFILPRLFAQAARTKSPEVFLSTSLVVVIVAALTTSETGLSPIVGALIAGLLIAETEYHAQVEAITAPFKGLALGVFLLTVGMSIRLDALWDELGAILLAVVLVVAFKAAVTAILLRLMSAGRNTAIETGILMASPSETTLIVLSAATSAQLISSETAQFWQIVTAIGLTVTPLLAQVGRRIGRRAENTAPRPPLDHAADSAIIVGFGRVGQLVADMLSAHGKPFVAIDSDPDLVRAAHRRGQAIAFGDVATAGVLDRLGIATAPAVILTMDEPVAIQGLVRRLRARYPTLPLIARARDAAHAAQLYRAGATHAVPETLESSLQLSEAVLVDLGVPMGPVIASIHEKRDELRALIMEEGQLDTKPKLRTTSLRERVGPAE